MMPGSHEDEIANRAQLIMRGTATQASNEHIKVILYGLSNNLVFSARGDLSRNENASRWGMIVNLIERSGMLNQSLNLVHQKDLTIASVAERMFDLSVEFKYVSGIEDSIQASNAKIITWLLDSEQNLNTSTDNSWKSSALWQAVKSHDFQFAIQLIDNGADPNLYHHSPLFLLLEDECHRLSRMTPQEHEMFIALLHRLLNAGARLHEDSSEEDNRSALMLAVAHDLQTADILIQHGANILYQRSAGFWPDGFKTAFCSTQSVAGFVAFNESEELAIKALQHLLAHGQRLDPPVSAADFISTDVLCNAASQGFDDLITLCFNFNPSIAVAKDKLFLALCAASFNKHPTTCKLLLQYGAPVNGLEGTEETPLPLHFAALAGDFAVVKLLCGYGANVDAGFTFETKNPRDDAWSRIIEEFGVDSALPRSDGPVFMNSLGAAILGYGDEMMPTFGLLIRHGAMLPNWAVSHTVRHCCCMRTWVVRIAMEQGVDLNWRGPSGETALQIALSRLRHPVTYSEPSRHDVCEEDGLLDVINSLVNAGAETSGSEFQIAIHLGRWDLFGSASPSSTHCTAQQTTCQISMLAAAFLTRSSDIIERALAQSPTAYDSGALCASVMLAISSGTTHSPLQQLLNNYVHSIESVHIEGLSLGLAAWHKRIDLLDMLLVKVRSSTPALLPVYTYVDPPSYWVNEISVIPEKKNIGYILAQSFRQKIPFWHRESRSLNNISYMQGSPLILALWSDSCLDKLIEHNFYPDRLTMSIAVRNGEVEILERLLRLPRLDNGHAAVPGPLYVSVKYGFVDVMRLLLEAGEDPNENNLSVARGRSPLQQAVADGKLEMIELLLGAKADVNTPAAADRGATALQLAAIKGRIGIAKVLIDHGADIDAPGAERGGRTALEGAAEHGRLDMIHYLLERGSVTTGDNCLQYFRAIRFARRDGHLVVANSLMNHREWTDLDHQIWERMQSIPIDVADQLVSLDKLMNSSESEDGTGCNSSDSSGDVDESEVNSTSEGPQEDSGSKANDMSLDEQRIPSNGIETTWNQHLESTNYESRISMPPMSIHTQNGGIIVEKQEVSGFGAEVLWNQQYQTANWFQSRGFVAAEMETGTCFEIPEGQMNWSEAQHDQSRPFDMDWFASQSVMSMERETGVCYEMPEGEMSWLETQHDGGQMFGMDWSQ